MKGTSQSYKLTFAVTTWWYAFVGTSKKSKNLLKYTTDIMHLKPGNNSNWTTMFLDRGNELRPQRSDVLVASLVTTFAHCVVRLKLSHCVG